MARFLIIILLVVLALWLLARLRRNHARTDRTGTRLPEYRRMVRCEACGVHLPAERALVDANGRSYCCAEHRLRPRAPREPQDPA